MNVCELRGLKIPQGDVHERRAMIASELADDEAERARPLEFDYWELGGEKGIETSEGFNVNVMSRHAALDRPGRHRLPAGAARLLGSRRHAAGHGPRGRLSPPARTAAIAPWPSTGVFPTRRSAIVGRGRPLYARRLHDCHFRKCLAAIEDSLGVTRDHAQHLVDVHGVAPADADARTSADERAARFNRPSRPPLPKSLRRSSSRSNGRCGSSSQQRRHQHPTSLWLMGGGASMRNIGPYLAAALRLARVDLGIAARARTSSELPHGPQAALFGPALALSALAWRAA